MFLQCVVPINPIGNTCEQIELIHFNLEGIILINIYTHNMLNTCNKYCLLMLKKQKIKLKIKGTQRKITG